MGLRIFVGRKAFQQGINWGWCFCEENYYIVWIASYMVLSTTSIANALSFLLGGMARTQWAAEK